MLEKLRNFFVGGRKMRKRNYENIAKGKRKKLLKGISGKRNFMALQCRKYLKSILIKKFLKALKLGKQNFPQFDI